LFWYVPSEFNIIIIRNTQKTQIYLYVFSKVYFVKVPLPTKLNTLPLFDTHTRVLVTDLIFINTFSKLFNTLINAFFKIFIRPFFLKLKFKGKGYYLYKSYRSTITPQFGYSHRLYVYTPFTFLTFLTKTSLVIFGLNFRKVVLVGKYLYNLRPINIFTGRGVRFSTQIVYKKSGKISSYR
jgi:hypothetical protein